MTQIPEDPIIARLMRYGVDDGNNPVCPICGDECETFYKGQDGEVFACDVCLVEGDAAEWSYDEDHDYYEDFECPCCGKKIPAEECFPIYFDRFGQQIMACEECVVVEEATFDEEDY